jgi:NAD(P)-dependent dehydrogenase (short-subunit alcohol dehydrogenase family)
MAQSRLAGARRQRRGMVDTEPGRPGGATASRCPIVLITGAAGGIGGATARAFAISGAHLILLDREPLDAHAIRALGDAGAKTVLPLQCDVSDEQQVAAAYSMAVQTRGAPTVVVNIAGKMIYKSLETLTAADWIESLSVNFLSAAFLIRQALLSMSVGGTIVNVSSIHAQQTSAQVAPYAAAKAALVSLTRSAAIEGKPKGIRVNAILPGAIDTAMLRDSPNIKAGIEKLEPSQVGKPGDVAAAIVFLSADAASFITGTTLLVDGGRLAQL